MLIENETSNDMFAVYNSDSTITMCLRNGEKVMTIVPTPEQQQKINYWPSICGGVIGIVVGCLVMKIMFSMFIRERITK